MFVPVNLKNSSSKDIRNNFNKRSFTKNTDTKNIDFSNMVQEEVVKQSINKSINHNNSAPNRLEDIADLFGELEQLGENISKLPSLDNFFSYRKTLQKILQNAIPHALEIHKDYSLNANNLSQKEYHLITRTNQEVNSLLELVESNHKNYFIIANKIVSIKGLIVDFYG